MHLRFKRWRRNTAIFLAPVLLVVGISVWFLFPPQEAPTPSDAVMVIAGASDGRHELGGQLVKEGISQNFVVSNPEGIKDTVGFAHCQGEDRPEAATRIWCLRPSPVTTAGEALTMDKLSEEEGWSTLTVVTNRPHTRRVRTMFEQCTDLNAVVVSVDDLDMAWVPYLVTREIGAYFKFWFTSPC